MRSILILFLLALLLARPLNAHTGDLTAELMAIYGDVLRHDTLAAKAEEEGRLDEAERLLWRALELVRQKGEYQNMNVAAKRNAIALFYERSGRFDDAERLLKQNIEIFETTPADNQRSKKAFEFGEALAAFYERGKRFTEAEAALRWIAVPGSALPGDYNEPLLNLSFAILYARSHRFTEATAYEQRTVALLTDVRDKTNAGDEQARDRVNTGVAVRERLGTLAGVYDDEGRPDLAEAAYVRCGDLGCAQTSDDLVRFYWGRGDYSRAEEMEKRILATEKSTPPRTTTLAALYEEQGRYQEAEQLIKDELAFYESRDTKPSWQTVYSQDRLAAFYAGRGRHAEAESLFRRALETPDPHGYLGNLRLAARQKGHGDALKALGREAEAKSRYDEAERTLKSVIEESYNRWDVWSRLNARLALAGYYAEWGRNGEALPEARQALTLTEKHYGAEDSGAVGPLQLIADILASQGDHVQARDYARRALAIRERTQGPDHPGTKQSRTELQNLEAQIQSAPVPKAN